MIRKEWQLRSVKGIVMLLVLLAVGGLNGCGSDKVGHVAYVTLASGNQVAGYKVDGGGRLSNIAGSPYSGGPSPEGISIHPSKKFLYTANSGGANVSLFKIDSSSGALSEETSSRTTAGTNPSALAMDSKGKFLYVANKGSNNISVFSINSTSGALTEVTGSPFPTGTQPIALTLSPRGFLYVANSGAGSVSAYQVSSSGGLTEITGSPYLV